MDRALLQGFLAEGMSLEAIANVVERHPSTVSYWLEKHGLAATGHGVHAPRGGLDRETLAALVAQDLTVAEIARRVDRGGTTVRYWLTFHGLSTTRAARRRAGGAKPALGAKVSLRQCQRHGWTRHVRRSGDRHRCARCNSEAVSRWRRETKRRLVEEAGGACAVCGYATCVAALQFHHVDPSQKRFALSLKGVARSLDTVRAEARKCVLLCANCHAEVEAGVTRLPGQCTGRG
jgi:transposase